MIRRTFRQKTPEGRVLKEFKYGEITGVIILGNYSINGLALLPDGHPWLDTERFPLMGGIPTTVHGGITCREEQFVGFDTSDDGYHPEGKITRHLDVDLWNGRKSHVWTLEEVEEETRVLCHEALKAWDLDHSDHLTVLCGPMTGEPAFNYPAFWKAARKLRDKGINVVSPAETPTGQQMEPPAEFHVTDYRRYMLYSLTRLLTAARYKGIPSICLLPGWERSKGAQLEKAVAEAIGLNVWLLKDLLNEKETPNE